MPTAPGHNEVLVGRAIAGRRDEVQLATKAGLDFTIGRGKVVIRNDPNYIKAAADASLLRLGTDRSDLCYLHRVNPKCRSRTPSARSPKARSGPSDCPR
jgi:aryl-alcohol dehydrogenase-like predicted oxidoreductase